MAPRVYRSSEDTATATASALRDAAIAAASAWATRNGILRSTFVRVIERVEALAPVERTAADRDAFSGLAIVEARSSVTETPAIRPDADHHRVFFRLATGEGTVDAAGPRPFRVVGGDPHALHRRAIVLAVSALVGVLATVFAAYAYRARDPWFASHGALPIVCVAGAMATVAWTLGIGEGLLGRGVRRAGRLAFLGACGLLAVGWAVLSAFALAPRTSNAIRLLDRGQRVEAFAEARAVDATREGAAASAVDALHLRLVPADASVDVLLAAVRRPWTLERAREQMIDRLRRTATARANALVASQGPASELAHVADTIAEWMPRERHVWRGAAALLSARDECGRCAHVGEVDVNCFRRHADAARDDGVSETDVETARGAVVPAVRQGVQLILRIAEVADDAFRLQLLRHVVTCAESIMADLHGDPEVDVEMLRARIGKMEASMEAANGPRP